MTSCSIDDRRLPSTFWRQVSPEPNSGCWLWTGMLYWRGYGKLTFNARTSYAHRVAYRTLVGEVPDGLELDHLCRTRSCCNPSHLEAVTHLVNMRRGRNARLTHCPAGHPYDADGTYRDGHGHRHCKKCWALNKLRSAVRRGKEYEVRDINSCDGCKSVRQKGRHWFYIYPDIVKPGQLEPIQVLCPSCAGTERVAARALRRGQARKRDRQ